MQKIYIFGLVLLLTACTAPSDDYIPERKVTPQKNNMIYSPGPKVQVSPVKAPSRPTTSRSTGRK